jgi:hypothetical protein
VREHETDLEAGTEAVAADELSAVELAYAESRARVAAEAEGDERAVE